MGVLARLLTPSQVPALTRNRIYSSYAVAVITDVVQFGLGPLGWVGADQVIDVVAAAVQYRLLGFHPLLLPTFLLELLPVTDMLPTWTACVAVVISTRKARVDDDPPPPGPGQVIDV